MLSTVGWSKGRAGLASWFPWEKFWLEDKGGYSIASARGVVSGVSAFSQDKLGRTRSYL